jgi:hypothetical protein
MIRPDFFIVGAPKCGTTSLHDYLRQHPDIFMPTVKELNYFGSDRVMRHTPRLTLDEYLSHFSAAPAGARVGEASVSYLRSTRAADEIAEFAPGAQAIIMLRNPVEVMHALHAELAFLGVEDLDFPAALAAESDRRAGRRVPAAANNPRAMLYREAVDFPDQVRRYFDALGRSRVHIVLFEEFRDATMASVQETYRFLGVDPSFQPDLPVLNASKTPRSRIVQRIAAAPPDWLRRSVRRLLPRPARKRLYRRVMKLNAQPQTRTPMPPDLRAQLTADLAPMVAELGTLLEIDLSRWTTP